MLIAVIESEQSVTRLEWFLSSPQILEESGPQNETGFPDIRISFIDRSAFEQFTSSDFSSNFSSDHILDLSTKTTLKRFTSFDFLIRSFRTFLRNLPSSLPHRFLRTLSVLQLVFTNNRLSKTSKKVECFSYTSLNEIIEPGDVDAFIADSPQAVEICNNVRSRQRIYIL